MNDIQILAVRAALDKMMREDGYLNICTIDKILQVTGGIPRSDDYRLLTLLHCVSFRDMEPELLRGLPVIMKRVLESDGIEITFNAMPDRRRLQFVDVKPNTKRLSA